MPPLRGATTINAELRKLLRYEQSTEKETRFRLLETLEP